MNRDCPKQMYPDNFLVLSVTDKNDVLDLMIMFFGCSEITNNFIYTNVKTPEVTVKSGLSIYKCVYYPASAA